MAESDIIRKPHAQPVRRLMAGILFLLGGLITWGLFYTCTNYNLLGFRGSPRESNPFAHQNVRIADLIVLGIIGAIVTVLTMYRSEQKLASSFVYGLWLGILAGLAMILLR